MDLHRITPGLRFQRGGGAVGVADDGDEVADGAFGVVGRFGADARDGAGDALGTVGVFERDQGFDGADVGVFVERGGDAGGAGHFVGAVKRDQGLAGGGADGGVVKGVGGVFIGRAGAARGGERRGVDLQEIGALELDGAPIQGGFGNAVVPFEGDLGSAPAGALGGAFGMITPENKHELAGEGEAAVPPEGPVVPGERKSVGAEGKERDQGVGIFLKIDGDEPVAVLQFPQRARDEKTLLLKGQMGFPQKIGERFQGNADGADGAGGLGFLKQPEVEVEGALGAAAAHQPETRGRHQQRRGKADGVGGVGNEGRAGDLAQVRRQGTQDGGIAEEEVGFDVFGPGFGGPVGGAEKGRRAVDQDGLGVEKGGGVFEGHAHAFLRQPFGGGAVAVVQGVDFFAAQDREAVENYLDPYPPRGGGAQGVGQADGERLGVKGRQGIEVDVGDDGGGGAVDQPRESVEIAVAGNELGRGRTRGG